MRSALLILAGGVVLLVAGLVTAAYALAGTLAGVSTGLIAAGVPVVVLALYGMDVGGRGKR